MKEANLKRIFQFVLLAGVLVALVLAVSAVLSGGERWNTERLVVRHSECSVQRTLGPWIEVTCTAGGPLDGHLAGVSGGTAELRPAIADFVAAFGPLLSCGATRSGDVRCVAGSEEMSDHLIRQGHAKPEQTNRIAQQGWIATLLAVSGAIVAFLIDKGNERAKDMEVLDAQREQIEEHHKAVNAALTSVYTEEKNGASETLANKKDHLKAALDDLDKAVSAVSTRVLDGSLRRKLRAAIAAVRKAPEGNVTDIRANLDTAINEIGTRIRKRSVSDV